MIMENEKSRIGFVSMEVLISDLRNYAGGLGILAGGLFSAARDIRYPMTGFTLVYKKGYVKNRIQNGEIIFEEDPFDPEEFFIKIKRKFCIDLENMKIWFQAWKYNLSDDVEVYFIDTDIEENDEKIRRLSDRVYIDRDKEEFILKRILLGLGTLKIVDELNLPIKKFHLNESHCVFLAIELLKRYQNIEKTKNKIIFTSHTPLPHGHEVYEYEHVEKYYKVPDIIKSISPEKLHTTLVLLKLSSYKNCVSWKHWLIIKKMFHDEDIDYITNGVHTKWIEQPMRILYDKYIPRWFHHPEKFVYAGNIDLEELKEAKQIIKKKLINVINSEAIYNKRFDKTSILLVLRRRITGYKRNDIVFKDIERIEEISKRYKVQVLVSGTLHPHDNSGKKILKYLLDIMPTLNHSKLAILLKNGKPYERIAVSGGDLFIHSPIPPYEACGTSWMRASLNAVPVLSSKDGGTLEAIVDGYNGWFFGKNILNPEEFNEKEDIKDFYDKLEEILKLYREREHEYLQIGRNALKVVGSLFNTHRTLTEYIKRAYEK